MQTLNNDSVKVIVCCHKKDVYAESAVYMPIHVGKAISQTELGIQGDDCGDNISNKNKSYCELTGIYWAWKNLKGIDVIGLSHYRRYFDFHHKGRSWHPYTSFPSSELAKTDLTIPPALIKRIKQGAVVFAEPTNCAQNLYADYCCCHMSDDFRVLEQVIFETQPEDIKRSFKKVMYKNNKRSSYNMFVMNWKDFDAYCSWLFPLLEEVEKRIDITHYSDAQKRIFGYMSERLQNVWVDARACEVVYKPVLWFMDGVDINGNRPRLVYRLRSILNNIACMITAPR